MSWDVGALGLSVLWRSNLHLELVCALHVHACEWTGRGHRARGRWLASILMQYSCRGVEEMHLSRPQPSQEALPSLSHASQYAPGIPFQVRQHSV